MEYKIYCRLRGWEICSTKEAGLNHQWNHIISGYLWGLPKPKPKTEDDTFVGAPCKAPWIVTKISSKAWGTSISSTVTSVKDVSNLQGWQVTWFFDYWNNDLILANWCQLKVRISRKLHKDKFILLSSVHLLQASVELDPVGIARTSQFCWQNLLLQINFTETKKNAEVSLTETWMVGTKGCAACIGRNFFPFHTRKQWTAGARPETISTEFAMEGTFIQTSDHSGYYRGAPICSHARVTEWKVWANFMSFAVWKHLHHMQSSRGDLRIGSSWS